MKFTADNLKKTLDEYISGQEELKRSLSTIGHMHFMKIYADSKEMDLELPRQSLMLVGGTGSGKSYCVSKFAESLDLPYLRVDASTLSNPGWAGVSLHDYLSGYRDDYKDHDLEYYGVVFIDEIDKLGNHQTDSGGGNVSLYLQSSLLDFLEGKTINVDIGMNRVESYDTSRFLVILGGSFEEVRKYTNKKAIGFHDEETKSLSTDDWRKFMLGAGLTKELVGRITLVNELVTLTDEEIRDAILNSKGSAYEQYYNMFRLYDRQFWLGNENIEKIIKKVKTSNAGLREIDTQIAEYALKEFNRIGRNIEIEEVALVDMPEEIDDTIVIEKQKEGRSNE